MRRFFAALRRSISVDFAELPKSISVKSAAFRRPGRGNAADFAAAVRQTSASLRTDAPINVYTYSRYWKIYLPAAGGENFGLEALGEVSTTF